LTERPRHACTTPQRRDLKVLLAVAIVFWMPAMACPAANASSASKRHHGGSPPSSCPNARLAQVTVSPLPGTPEASPETQVSLLGVSVSQVRSIYVAGSRSGRHGGTLRSYDSETGASFLPSKGFAPGETVSVCATVRTAKGKRRVGTSFQVADEAHPTYEPPFEYAGTRGDERTFHSVDYKAPIVTVGDAAGAQSAPGYLFATPLAGPGEHGAMIFTSSGELVWFHRPPNPEWGTADLQLQSYAGHEDLVYWQGLVNSFGFGAGEDLIVNSAYETLARVKGGNGLQADLHDIQITPDGAAYITAYYPVWAKVPVAHGAGLTRRAIVLDSVIQEIDVGTGLVMWEWQSLGHVPLGQSRIGAPQSGEAPYDYFGIDSLQPLPGGNLLVCARNTWGVYSIHPHTGAIAWQLGTRKSSLKLGPGARYAWPEQARILPTGQLLLYDGGAKSTTQPRGELLELQWAGKQASLTGVGQLRDGAGTPRDAGAGSVQQLPGGNWLVGWGGLPSFTEYDSEGNVIYDARFPAGEVGYRVSREPWQGQPSAPPNLVASTNGATTTVYVSWNGATDVASWRLFGGASAQTLETLASAPATGYETTISSRAATYVLVQALNAAGEVIGESKVIAAARS
jgi:Arylsulfotransferase (ASST)